MHAAKGILTARGGMTSHAAVVARGMGRPCVSGSSEIDIDYEKKIFKTASVEIKEGDIITIDGSSGRIISVREMILSKTKDDRLKALLKLLPHQKKDFVEIFKIMHGLPVTVRLLDPPLHEFLPKSEKEISEVAEVVGISVKEVKSRIDELHEQNPMLGHRGCRLGISFPEIYEMQCEAIFKALSELKKDKQKFAFPEIMIPLVLSLIHI